MAWAGGYSDADFFSTVQKDVTVVRDGSIVYNSGGSGWSKVANVNANTPTGYYSSKASCNLNAGVLPGTWKTPLVWESYCHSYTNHELSLIELVGNASGQNRSAFCNSLTDKGGNPRVPQVCGGSDPDLFTYNPNEAAGEDISEEISGLASAADAEAERMIKESRKKIFSVAFIILILIAVCYLIYKL